jgi:hypothetical protein
LQRRQTRRGTNPATPQGSSTTTFWLPGLIGTCTSKLPIMLSHKQKGRCATGPFCGKRRAEAASVVTVSIAPVLKRAAISANYFFFFLSFFATMKSSRFGADQALEPLFDGSTFPVYGISAVSTTGFFEKSYVFKKS